MVGWRVQLQLPAMELTNADRQNRSGGR